ncbi:MAG: HEAT repeat domain-containing protein [Gemmataceae bacterium]
MKLKRIAAVVIGVLAVAAAQGAPPKLTDIPPLIKQLKAADAKERVTALQELSKIAQVKVSFTKVAIPGVIESLKDADGGVRREAAITLSYLQADPKVAVPPLHEALKDKDGNIRRAVADTLAEFGGEAKEALPTLLEIQKELAALPKEDQQKIGDLIQSINRAVGAIRGQ